MSLQCATDTRRDAVRKAGRFGVDYVESDDGPPVRLHVQLLGRLPPEAIAFPSTTWVRHLRLEGGDRIKGLHIKHVQVFSSLYPQLEDHLELTLEHAGDFSAYTLTLVGLPGLDTAFTSSSFRFRVEPATGTDCRVPADAKLPPEPAPRISYLAKDYASLRQMLLDRLSIVVPDWTESHVADLGVSLVELLAYAGDYLSYYQDAVATEAYLSTARQRISVRRHARLVGYRLHEGCNARAWVHLSVKADLDLLPRQLGFITGANGSLGAQPTLLDESQLLALPPSTYEYFEPLVADPRARLALRRAHSEIALYTWGRDACCLPIGATQAMLVDEWLHESGDARALQIAPGDIVILEEVMGPLTGAREDADPNHRWAVRVLGVTRTEDALFQVDVNHGGRTVRRPTPLLEVRWGAADALPFALCLSAVVPWPSGLQRLRAAVVRANVVLVDHGRTMPVEALGTVPTPDAAAASGGAGPPEAHRLQAMRYRPTLAHGSLTHVDPKPPWSLPASVVTVQDPTRALPAVTRLDDGRYPWSVRQDLIESGPEDRDFVVEVDDQGLGHLRFGDGQLGRPPDPGSRFVATYRVGCGLAGNVARDAITHLVLYGSLKDDGAILELHNPLPAQGGVDPEPIEQARLFAPLNFSDPRKIERAITAEDYATIAARHAGVQRAAARLAWTGSWFEADVAIDPLGSEVPGTRLLRQIEVELSASRRIGHDLKVRAAAYVPIVLSLTVVALPGYDRGHLRAALAARLGPDLQEDGTPGYFHPDRFSFGDSVYLSSIESAAQSIVGISSVQIDSFHRYGEPSASEIAQGVLPIAHYEIAQLDNDADHPERGWLGITVRGGR